MKKTVVFLLLLYNACLFAQSTQWHVNPAEKETAPVTLFKDPLYISVLKDRIFLKCPATAKSEPRPHNLMEAPPSEEQETRILFDLGDKRMVIFAQEMNALAGKNLLKDVKSLYTNAERADYVFQEINTPDSMPAVLTLPAKHDTSQEAILINSVLIETKDSSLIQIGAYINPKAYSSLKAYLALSDSILKSAIAGNRKIEFHARNASLPLAGNLSKLIAEIPDHYLTIIKKGDDFTTYQIRKIQNITTSIPGGIIIYSGSHPSLLAPTYNFSPENGKEKTDLFLGKKMRWTCYDDETKKLHLKELIYDEGKGLKIHIAIVASSEKELEALDKIVRKMILRN
jgi:hypothetical protein